MVHDSENFDEFNFENSSVFSEFLNILRELRKLERFNYLWLNPLRSTSKDGKKLVLAGKIIWAYKPLVLKRRPINAQ